MKGNKIKVKKYVAVATIFILISSFIIPMSAAQIDFNAKRSDKLEINTFDNLDKESSFATHHKVLAEQCTATWCVHCPSMGYWLGQVSGDFMYIALVQDKNSIANARIQELGIPGYPTSWFDGKYTSVVGHQYSVTNVQNAYDACQSRSVADVDILPVAVIDEAASTLDIKVFVDNTGSTQYNGHLHGYVIEKVSPWLDYDGDPYKNAMIGGYAFNENIQINPGGTWTGTRDNWMYPGMVKDNIQVVVAVFDTSTNNADDCAVVDATTGGGGGGGDDPILPPVIKISNPYEGQEVNETIKISGTAHHPYGDGRLKWVFIKIDDNSWEMADGTVDWEYEWNTNTVWDGLHNISAISSDGTRESGIHKIGIYVKNNESEEPEENYPDLVGEGSLSWSDISPKLVISGEFTVENAGDEESELAWEVESYPAWGDWTFQPSDGEGLTPSDGPFTVRVLVVAPDETEQEFSGQIKVVNKFDSSDYDFIQVSLTTPKNHRFSINWLFLRLLENNHPRLFTLLQKILL